MRNFYFLILLFLGTFAIKAQDLASCIPNDVHAIVTVRGKNITELVSVSEFNHSKLGNEILQALSKKTGKNLIDANELGIALDSKGYYFFKRSDSISFHGALFPLKDASKFSQLFQKNSDKIEIIGNYSMLRDGNDIVLLWDHQKALLLKGNLNDYYFDTLEVTERYGIPDMYAYDYYYQNEAVTPADTTWTYDDPPRVENVEIPAKEEGVVMLEEDVSTQPVDLIADYSYDQYAEYDSIAPATDSYDYDAQLELKQQKLDSLNDLWVANIAQKTFRTSPERSILKNSSYQMSLDPKAEASLWVPNLFSAYGFDEPMSELIMGQKLYTGFKSFHGNLYAENDQIMVHTNMELTDELAGSFEKIYDHKINRKFLNYIDSEKTLGFTGYAINTEAYLNEMPTMLSSMYGSNLFGLYNDKETVNFVIDLVSVLLDEQAVAEVLNGDALLVLNGVSEKEVTYTDYIYDENYNSTEVEKTKTETVPDFLFMLSSDNLELIKKLLNLAIREGKMTEQNGIYHFEDQGDYFTFHILLKDGIVFMGTSLDEIIKIKTGTFKGNISREHRKLIKKNVFMACFVSGNVYGAIPEKDLLSLSQTLPYFSEMEQMGNWYLKSSGVKNNNFSAEFVIETPNSKENSLKYLLNLINRVEK